MKVLAVSTARPISWRRPLVAPCPPARAAGLRCVPGMRGMRGMCGRWT
ncbi:hypothetical protein [Sphaerisporangium sp. TRM90804]|nr:hypothetical protein [Sphaerisporangium sp. TRM90804]MDH2428812.1 hypothetical protein [Sphaerisporangium sp. TRM90804]